MARLLPQYQRDEVVFRQLAERRRIHRILESTPLPFVNQNPHRRRAQATKSVVLNPLCPATTESDADTLPGLLHNREDGCVVCPFSDIPDLLERFKNAPRKQLIAVQGGDPPLSDPCEALSRHGYLGIEGQVVGTIADWMTAK